MGLYLANHSLLVHLGSKLYELNVGSPMKTTLDRLLSSDNFVLKDLNGVYLIPVDGNGSGSGGYTDEIPLTAMLSSDDYIFTELL